MFCQGQEAAPVIHPVLLLGLWRFVFLFAQRSISFRSESRPDLLGPRPWSRNAAPSSTKRRDSKLWSETFDVCVNQMLTSKEIKRQEVGWGPGVGRVFGKRCTAGESQAGIYATVSKWVLHRIDRRMTNGDVRPCKELRSQHPAGWVWPWLKKKTDVGTSLVVQWLRLGASNVGGPGSIPGQRTRSHMPQLKIPHATTKTYNSQINK